MGRTSFFSGGTLSFYFPQTDSLAQYVTRFVTHFCAPGFIFLAGMMVALASSRKDYDATGRKDYSAYLMKRGILFVSLEVTLIQLIWGYHLFLYPQAMPGELIVVNFGIISLFGFLFIILSFIRKIHSFYLFSFSMGTLLVYWVAFPSLAQKVYMTQNSTLVGIATILFLPTENSGGAIISGIYPVFPWISVILLGLLYGRLCSTLSGATKIGGLKKYSFLLGVGLILFFIIYESSTGTRLSKYPPSLGFLTLTLGVVLLLLGSAQFFEERGIPNNILQTYGRVPFFFYIVHLFMYSLIPSLTGTYAGYSLLTTYFAWFCGLPLLYFLCRWFYDFKKKRKDSFLKYI